MGVTSEWVEVNSANPGAQLEGEGVAAGYDPLSYEPYSSPAARAMIRTGRSLPT